MKKVITFSHPKGGVGKTMLAFNYAVYKQLHNVKTILIDLDKQYSTSDLNKMRQIKNLPLLEIEFLGVKTRNELNDFIEKQDDKLILIDTGGFDSSLNRVALALSDIIITPTSDSPIEILRLIKFDKILADINSLLKTKTIRASIALNNIHHSVKNLESVKKPFNNCKNLKFLNSIVRNRARYKFSLGLGKSIFEDNKEDFDEKANNELLELFNEIDKLIIKD